MRLHLSWSETQNPSFVPMKSSEMKALFKFLHAELKSSDLYARALHSLEVKSVGSLSLYFCDDAEMREFQKRYRKLDRTTDILSFPSREVPGASGFMRSLPVGERSWGDLIVSMPTVERGAKRGRRSVSDELSEVLVHGFLHLLGLDHIVGKGVTPADARRMKALQRKLFRKWKQIQLPKGRD